MSSSPVLRASRGRRVRKLRQLAANLYADALSYYLSYGLGENAVLDFVLLKAAVFLNQDRLTLPPRGTRTEIETIYRAYQVLLLIRLRT